MAERRGDQTGLTDAAAAAHREEQRRHHTMNSPNEPTEDCLSLEDILRLYSQPINEEQAWAVCYQCCRTLAKEQRGRRRSSAAATTGASSAALPRRISGPGDVRIQKDGSVRVEHQDCEGKYSPCTTTEVIESLGIMIYKALDYGLKENEERELSAPLEELIAFMTNMVEAERDACPDEGYEATEEEDEMEDESDSIPSGYRDILQLCTSHLPALSDATSHYQAVCRALYTETRELHTFLEKIKSAKENLRKMEEESSGEPGRDLNELQNADWARCWVQVMRNLRDGVKLKKVQERQYNPLPIEFQLTPYEMLMDDIRSRRYKLRKVMTSGPKGASGFRIRGREWVYSWWNGRGEGSRAGRQGRGTDEGRAADESRPGRGVEPGKQIIAGATEAECVVGDRKQAGFLGNRRGGQDEDRQVWDELQRSRQVSGVGLMRWEWLTGRVENY
ncbi:Protein spire -like protein 1 [Takifugu flavidus]|uniref:Protein spire-like protein 1 n=1 Tax=Takifugu flavidus TaxID=433684 RepID=A0A5C6PL89_9TELE|nr:Protein spire -like protein 1 [Takifugu flavidus]